MVQIEEKKGSAREMHVAVEKQCLTKSESVKYTDFF